MPTQNSVTDLIDAPWYQSSAGPGVSSTLISIAGNIIPIANLVLAQNGVNLFPAQVNGWISLGVFLFFSARAAYFYVRAKSVFAQKLGQLQRENHRLAQNSGETSHKAGLGSNIGGSLGKGAGF